MSRFLFTAALSFWMNAGEPRPIQLDQPCPIEWQAVPLSEALRTLASQLDVPYVIEASVSDEALAERVRLAAAHLSGRQAFRWTARAAGLDAILVEGAMLVAPPGRLPMAWRISGTADGQHGLPQTSQPSSFEQVRVDLKWVDVPLSRVSRDVSSFFGLDVAFHPDLIAEQRLMRLEQAGVGLADLQRALTEQLGAASRLEDGVLWVEPLARSTSQPATRPGVVHPTAAVPAPVPPVLSQQVAVGMEITTWEALQGYLAQVTGVECRIDAAPGSPAPGLSMRGTVYDLLQAGKTLDGWSWRLNRNQNTGRPFLLIQVPVSGRSVG